MQKNIAGQKIGAQLTSATDGSAFTGAVTIYVTGDAGTQAVGSVGAGACTHEGLGYHTYAPSQAETNYDLIAFTFTGAGAIGVTVQIYTRVDSNLTHIAAVAVSTSTAQLGVNIVNFGGSAGTFASGRPETNTTHIAGSTVSTTSAQIGVNVVQISTDTTAADNAEAFFDGTGYAGTNNVIPLVTTTTTTTNVTTVNGLAANVITAASIATDAGAEIADAVWDEIITGHSIANSTGKTLNDILQNDIWSDDVSGYSVGTSGYLLATRLASTVSGRTLDVSAGGEAGVDWANVGTPGSTVNLSATTVNLTNTLTTYTGNTLQTGDSYAIVNSGTHGNAAIKGYVDDIGVAGAGLTALGDVRIANLDATVSSRATQTSVNTIDDFVDTEIADIQARLPAALVGGRMDANMGAVSTDATAADNLEALLDGTGGITLVASAFTLITPIDANTKQISGSATAADRAKDYWSSVVSGTAQSATSNTIVLEAGESATDDKYNLQVVLILSGPGTGEVNKITDYTGASRTAALSRNWIETPDNTSIYTILGYAG